MDKQLNSKVNEVFNGAKTSLRANQHLEKKKLFTTADANELMRLHEKVKHLQKSEQLD